MKVQKINEFKRGWFVGNFDPTIYKTDKFEVGILHHKKGEEWPCHYHKSTEINYLISGELLMHGEVLTSGDIFMMEPYEVADPEFITDCTVLVIKTPSMPGDKYLADKPNKVTRGTV
jgi:quercetin dioxygenase-like cupin family protein